MPRPIFVSLPEWQECIDIFQGLQQAGTTVNSCCQRAHWNLQPAL